MNTSQETTLPPPQEQEIQFASQIQEAQENLNRLNEATLAFIRDRPIVCVLGAMTLGFVVGKIAARY
jgi:hypothetical protein